MNTKQLWGAVAVVAAGILLYGAYQYPAPSTSPTVSGTGTAGTTQNTAKYAGVVMTPSTASATSTTITNNDGTDRYIISTELGCEGLGTSLTAYTGAGLAALTLGVATSSSASPTQYKPTIQVGSITIATSVPPFLFASSSAITATTSYAAVWAAGSSMQFAFNATNTATCTVGVHYISS